MSDDVARGYHNLGNIIFKQDGDLVKAEKLVREAYRIRGQLPGEPLCLGLTANILGHILYKRGNHVEAKKMYERFLAVSMRHEGMDGVNTAISNDNIGKYNLKMADEQLTVDTRRRYLRLALPFFKQALRITTKLYGPAHPKSIDHTLNISAVTSELSEA
jgi:tetratricopeptide (TPR) repeat protein